MFMQQPNGIGSGMLARVILGLCSIVLSMGSALADWQYRSRDGALSNKKDHFAMSWSGKYIAGFRCSDKNDFAIHFIVDEKYTDTLRNVPFKLHVRIDDGEVSELPAVVSKTSEERIRFHVVGPDIAQICKSASAAKQRIALAVQVMDQRFFLTVFPVRGAADAITRLMTGCTAE
jgi:hypothetical protein